MPRSVAPLVILVLAVLIVVSGTFYRLNETEQVIITQFGKPVGGPITTPGLHIKTPFIQTVRRFDKRILEWDGETDQIPTLEKRFILLDTTARWRIIKPLRFLQSVGNEQSAQSRLDDIVESAARDVVSANPLIQVVRNFQRLLPEETEDMGVVSTVTPSQADEEALALRKGVLSEQLGREKLSELMLKRAQENMPDLGIQLIDIRVKRINYVREVEEEVYKRMISERQRVASRFRSEGDGESAEIQGQMERDLDQITSDAYRKAEEIIGQGDAEAARIYAEAYSADAEFYSYLQTLETYKHTMKGNASLLLTTDSDFYRYLKEGAGIEAPAALPKPTSPASGSVN
jgi:membrane protease subunit HflC